MSLYSYEWLNEYKIMCIFVGTFKKWRNGSIECTDNKSTSKDAFV